MQGTGIVSRIHERGFAWIEPHNAPSPAVFCHFKSLIDLQLAESIGRTVRFNAVPATKGTGLHAVAAWPE